MIRLTCKLHKNKGSGALRVFPILVPGFMFSTAVRVESKALEDATARSTWFKKKLDSEFGSDSVDLILMPANYMDWVDEN